MYTITRTLAQAQALLCCMLLCAEIGCIGLWAEGQDRMKQQNEHSYSSQLNESYKNGKATKKKRKE